MFGHKARVRCVSHRFLPAAGLMASSVGETSRWARVTSLFDAVGLMVAMVNPLGFRTTMNYHYVVVAAIVVGIMAMSAHSEESSRDIAAIRGTAAVVLTDSTEYAKWRIRFASLSPSQLDGWEIHKIPRRTRKVRSWKQRLS